MLRQSFLVVAICLVASSASAQVRVIDPSPKTGMPAAVVVSDSMPLLHTAQFVTTEREAKMQIANLLAQVRRTIPEKGPTSPVFVKLDFVVATDDLVPRLEQALALLASEHFRPAVSFVTGKLPGQNNQVALDAVVALPTSAALKQVSVTSQAAILPPGTRVWISGQAEKGADLAEATRKTMDSLRDSLKHVGLKADSIVQLKAFLQPMADVEIARKEMAKFFGDQPVPPMVFVEWKSSLPIEIELVAWGGRERAGEPLEFLTPPGMKASPVYSRIARVNYGKLIYVSGLHAEKADSPAAEITEVFDNLGGILKKAGSDYRHLAKATYYCTNSEAVKKMGELRPRYYDPKRPPSASLAMTEGTGRAGRSVTLDMIAVPSPAVNVNDYGPPEYGHGLKEADALEGWISLFDGKTTFGWSGAKLSEGQLSEGVTTSVFGPCQIQAEVIEPGELFIGEATLALKRGANSIIVPKGASGQLRLAAGASVQSLKLKPEKLEALFNGKDLTGWKRIDHAKLPKERWPSWTVEKGALHALGGPGCVEYQERRFGDLVLQVEARMNVRFANGGLFFRSIPGDFMNGYEAQLYNKCLADDPGKPATWATGAIDDRQNARRLMSRDGAWFVQTVIASGPHLATWVNGHQTVDWTDTRPPHKNPRQGLRVEPGTIQLQAHDVGTDIEFRRVAARSLDKLQP